MTSEAINPIKVSVMSVTKAQNIIEYMGFQFATPATNVFQLFDMDEWNDIMELFEENEIDIL